MEFTRDKLLRKVNISNRYIISALVSLRLAVIPLFVLWLTVLGKERLPMMMDQGMYLTDIHMITCNLESLFYPDKDYFAHNTLYSRIAGLIGWCLSFLKMPPLFAAVTLNTLSQLLLAVISVKLYQALGGKRKYLLFVCILFSPTVSAYTFFALRDVFIALCFSWFFLYIIKGQYVKALLVSGLFIFLRKFFFVFNTLLAMAHFVLLRVQKSRHKIIIGVLALSAFAAATYALLAVSSLSWVLGGIPGIAPGTFFTSALGLARFVSDADTTVSANEGVVARLMMFDSMLLPLLLFPATCILVKKGNAQEKVMSLLVLITVALLSISYLIIQGNFPLRKLLLVIPLMYIIAFRAFDHWHGSQKTVFCYWI